jgi:hypothetical protein
MTFQIRHDTATTLEKQVQLAQGYQLKYMSKPEYTAFPTEIDLKNLVVDVSAGVTFHIT